MTTDDDANKKKENEPANEPMDMEAVEDKTTSGLPNKEDVASKIIAGYEYIPETLRASDGIYWAELKVEYVYSGYEFICEVLAYRAQSNGGNKGDVEFYLSFESGAGEVIRLTENAIQDGEWHDLLHTGYLYPFGLPVTIGFDYIYDIAFGGDKILKTYVIKEFKPRVPILHITSNFVSSIFDVTGENGISAYTLVIDDEGPELGSKVLLENGGWSVPVTVVEADTQRIQAHQKYLHHVSERSPAITVYRSRITSPIPGSILLIKDLVFEGTAAPRTNVRLVNDKNHGDYLTETVVVGHSGTTWQALPIKPPPSGPVAVRALLTLPNQRDLYTEVVNFSFMGVPEIVSPAALTVVDQNFRLEGKNGFHRARFQVFPDLGDSPVGWEIVRDEEGLWTGLVGLPPGPVSLVVEQDLNGLRSGRSEPRGFRVRPPKLETPTFEFPVAETVQFSGTGHYDPILATRIRFIVKSYPGETPPNTPAIVTVQNDGSWGVTATGWGLGNYTVEVVQEIADNASGWIESHPCEFTINNDLPSVTDVTYTKDYQPTFNGKGYNGATVWLKDADGNEIAPGVVVRNSQWSSQALVPWGPTNKQEVHITQSLGEHSSQPPYVLLVSIPPLPPTVEEPPEEGLTPMFRGTCIEGATVSITFSGDNSVYAGVVNAGTWTFQRPAPFPADIAQRIFVSQTFVELTSDPQPRDFTVYPVMLTPLIDFPTEGSEVGTDVEIKGMDGVSGATMQLYEAQFQQKVGDPLLLAEDGEWGIRLTGLKFGPFTIYAKQERNGRWSEESARRSFNVVVPVPQITAPVPDGKLTRTATLQGVGLPFAQIEIWFEGAVEPWLSDIPVSRDGSWQRTVTMPVGNYTIRARQLFTDGNVTHESAFTENLTYDVIPAPPAIETPIEGEQVGRKVVVSGFGIAGDTVTVTLGSTTKSAVVLENRTWSVALEDQTDGDIVLEGKAMLDGFESDAACRSVVAGVYLPVITEPADGRWVHAPVVFAGTGEEGEGQVASWFNVELKWTPLLAVNAGQWRGESSEVLRSGGYWCRFRQTLTAGMRVSDWAQSARFEVMPVPGAIASRQDPTSG